MDYLEAVVTVLREEGEPLHWTRIQDLALRRGYIDPFVEPDVRKHLLAALAQGVRAGAARQDGAQGHVRALALGRASRTERRTQRRYVRPVNRSSFSNWCSASIIRIVPDRARITSE